MIRVLQVIGGLNRGGAETMIINLYRAINHDEIQFDFVIHDITQDAYIKEIQALGGRIFVFPKFTGKNVIAYRRHWRKFLGQHPEYKILHSHIRSYAVVFLPIAKKMGLKTIVHSHSTSNGNGIKSKIKAVLQKPLTKQADYLFACSEISGKWLFGEDGIKQDNYFMIKNAIDAERYRFNLEVREKVRKQLGISNQTVYGHVGRLSEPKNHGFLLQVFQEIHHRNANTVLLIVGSGELESEINNTVKQYNLSDCVKLLGSRSDIPELMQAMDIFLFPSLWEGLPVTVVEAQAAGLPCLVSDAVTKEVFLSDAVQYLPITEGINVWVEKALSIRNRFVNATDEVIRKGFDINSTARWLTDFYRGILNE